MADAHGSGPCESNFMEVQVLLSAPNIKNPNLISADNGFGFVVYNIFRRKVGLATIGVCVFCASAMVGALFIAGGHYEKVIIMFYFRNCL